MIYQTNSAKPFSVKIARKLHRFQTKQEAEKHLATERVRLEKIAGRQLTDNEIKEGITRNPGPRDRMRYKLVTQKPSTLMQDIDHFATKPKSPIAAARSARKEIYAKFKKRVEERQAETVAMVNDKQLAYAEKFMERALYDPSLPEHCQLLAQALFDHVDTDKWKEFQAEANSIEKQLHLEAVARLEARKLQLEQERIVEPIEFAAGTLADDIRGVISRLPADDPRLAAAQELQELVVSGTVTDTIQYSAAKVAANLDLE